MTSKERLQRILRGERTDRIGKAEAPWPSTRARWVREGLPPSTHANDHFQMDLRCMVRTDTSFLLPTEKVREEGEFYIARDANGVLIKGWKDEHATPHPLDFAIQDADDWARLRERLVYDDRRFSFGYYGDYGFEYHGGPLSDVRARIEAWPRCSDTFLPFSVLEPYEGTMCRVGDENLLVWMATEPELVTEMFCAHTDLAIACLEGFLRSGVKPDCVFVGGDIAYKQGLLFSRAMYRDLLAPHHQRLFRACREAGLPVIYHSDGRLSDALPLLIASGIDCIQPLEVAAGNDLAQFADVLGGTVSFMGNMSVTALSGTADEAVAEARRCIRAGKRTRGYILHSDHSLPDTVPLANYRAVMEVFEEEARR